MIKRELDERGRQCVMYAGSHTQKAHEQGREKEHGAPDDGDCSHNQSSRKHCARNKPPKSSKVRAHDYMCAILSLSRFWPSHAALSCCSQQCSTNPMMHRQSRVATEVVEQRRCTRHPRLPSSLTCASDTLALHL